MIFARLREKVQLVASTLYKRDDLRPVGRRGACGLRMHRRNGCLQRVRPKPAR